MRIIVAICVYNRFKNIERWVACWRQCNTENAELVIIHNYYGDTLEKKKYQSYCDANGIKYIPRNGQGFDIGAFQDVCKGRLKGFPDYDYMLWCTDDVLPMSKNFIQPFIEKFKKGVGVTCMQISGSVSQHVRTTGFCIKKAIAGKLIFPHETITTKEQCYFWEHRGARLTFTNQIRYMGLSCVAVATNEKSPLWDMGYWKRLDRMNEHEKVFGIEGTLSDKVVFICPIFNMYPQIISSLICQTHQNWELLLIYNGPCDNNLPQIVKGAEDKRITFIEYPVATGKWGHVLRQWALKEKELGAYTVITNADNYYVPTFIEYMLKGFKPHTAVATYCSQMTHSYKAWEVINVRFERGYIDCGGVMVKSDIAKEVGWRDTDGHSSDWTYFEDIASRYHSRNFIPVKGNLFVHN